jgi:hypothetical protein
MALVNFVARVTSITAAWLNKLDYTNQNRLQHYAVDSGTAGAYVLTVPAAGVDYILATGTLLYFKPLNTNVGASLINGLPVVDGAGNALTGGEINSAGIVGVVYNGTSFVLLNSASVSSNASFLNSQNGAFYQNSNNQNAGTLPDARFPATLPALSGVNLTALNASNLASGTVPSARFPATLPALSGANLTALNASNITSGTLSGALFPATLPAVNGSSLTNLNASALTSGTVPSAQFPATLPALSGVNLTSLNASNLASGTVANARLPNIGSMPGVTIAADPGGTPSGSPGQVFWYY